MSKNIQLEFKLLDQPYSDINDLVNEMVQIKSWSIEQNTVFIILPMYLAIKECFFNENRLEYSVNFHKKMKNNVSMGFIYRDKQGISKRFSKDIEINKLHYDDDFYSYRYFEKVDDGIISAQVFFHHKKIKSIIDETGEIIRLRPPDKMRVFEDFGFDQGFMKDPQMPALRKNEYSK